MGLEERYVLIRGRMEHDVRALPGEELGHAGRPANVSENGNAFRESLAVRQDRREVGERRFGAVDEDERRSIELFRAHGEPRAKESRGAGDQDGGALDVVRKVLGS